MIVKNESHVIRRCLNSVRRLVDFVLVEDTGSTDGTQQIIREWLAETGIPGEVVDVPWCDFGFNRTDALTRLRNYPAVDYALIIDADDTLGFVAGFDPVAFKQGLTADVVDFDIHYGALRYQRPHLLRNALPFCYRGVLHEFVQIPPVAKGRQRAEGVFMQIHGGGGRSQDGQKFVRDAEILEVALKVEEDSFLRSRYTFYLAQSCRDSGQNERALDLYEMRGQMGFWNEEVYVARYRAAQLKEKLGHPVQAVIDAYLTATAVQPARSEALHGASRFCRLQRLYEQGFWFAKRGIGLLPTTGLFIESWIYEYGLLDELAVNAYWSGRFEECRCACERLLRECYLPESTRLRVEKNLAFAIAKLQH